jgi:chemotaxis protein methyltransferase CheR
MAALSHSGAGAGAIEELEIDLLLEALHRRFGLDFRGYDRPRLARRVLALMREHRLATVSRLQERVLHHDAAARALLRALTVAPAAPFEDPAWARELRTVLGSALRPSPLPKVWLAECAGVGEAWTLAIVLAEEGVGARTEIYATLANDELAGEMRDASLPAASLEACQRCYEQSGGSGDLSAYFEIDGERASLKQHLKGRITWAQYSLVTDASFNEFDAIVCARALAEFGPVLRRRVLRLFHDSLACFGVLGIGQALAVTDACATSYTALLPHHGWHKRIG